MRNSGKIRNLLDLYRPTFYLLLTLIFIATGCKNDDSAAPAGGASSAAVTETRANSQSEPAPAPPEISSPDPNAPSWHRPRSNERLTDRQEMVTIINKYYGLKDKRVLEAMTNVPRHWFVRKTDQSLAYADTPLPIGHGQTISQPFIVAHMTELLRLDKNEKVLEIGTGSGYQAAVLNEFTPHVYTIEIVKPLAQTAIERFQRHGYKNIKVKIGDGYKGWPEYAPFDAIIVTAAAEEPPPPLIEQLKPGGKMYIPIGSAFGLQNLVLVQKDLRGRVTTRKMMPVRFVPFTREEELK